MYTIAQFHRLNKLEHVIITQHCFRRLIERGISVMDISNVIDTGEIIEQYPEDFPFASCLIMGKSFDKVIHICASIDSGFIYLITAYVPDSARWQSDFKTRKEDL